MSFLVTMSTTVDLEPLIIAMAEANKASSGASAPLTASELATVRTRAGEELDAANAQSAAVVKDAVSQGLPAGVRVVLLDAKRSGLVVTSRTAFAIDDAALLSKITIPGQNGGPPMRPFEGFVVKSAGGAISIEGSTPPMPDAEGSKAILRLEIEADQAATSHNATSVAGKKLVWEGPMGKTPLVVRAAFKA